MQFIYQEQINLLQHVVEHTWWRLPGIVCCLPWCYVKIALNLFETLDLNTHGRYPSNQNNMRL